MARTGLQTRYDTIEFSGAGPGVPFDRPPAMVRQVAPDSDDIDA
jgi:hypothetical protein